MPQEIKRTKRMRQSVQGKRANIYPKKEKEKRASITHPRKSKEKKGRGKVSPIKKKKTQRLPKKLKLPMLPRKATRGIFVHLKNHTLSLSFLPISGRKHFGELGDKTPQSHHIFFLSSFQPNTSFFSILPKIHSTKHTLRENCTHEGPQLAWILGSWMLE